MIFSKGKKDYSKYQFFQNNSQIEIVERYKYLDIVFYFNGNLKHAADDLYNKALKAFFSENQHWTPVTFKSACHI
jgi:hypothetical protein